MAYADKYALTIEFDSALTPPQYRIKNLRKNPTTATISGGTDTFTEFTTAETTAAANNIGEVVQKIDIILRDDRSKNGN